MSLFKKIGEFLVAFWDAVFGVKESSPLTVTTGWDKLDALALSAEKTPVQPEPEPENAPEISDDFYFNPFTGLLIWTWLEDSFNDPQYVAVPPQLLDAAERKTGKHIQTYVRFTDHRSALGHWASEVRKREGIIYDRKSIAAQNKAIAKLDAARKKRLK